MDSLGQDGAGADGGWGSNMGGQRTVLALSKSLHDRLQAGKDRIRHFDALLKDKLSLLGHGIKLLSILPAGDWKLLDPNIVTADLAAGRGMVPVLATASTASNVSSTLAALPVASSNDKGKDLAPSSTIRPLEVNPILLQSCSSYSWHAHSAAQSGQGRAVLPFSLDRLYCSFSRVVPLFEFISCEFVVFFSIESFAFEISATAWAAVLMITIWDRTVLQVHSEWQITVFLTNGPFKACEPQHVRFVSNHLHTSARTFMCVILSFSWKPCITYECRLISACSQTWENIALSIVVGTHSVASESQVSDVVVPQHLQSQNWLPL